MHSDTTSSSNQLGPHSNRTWAVYRHWQNANAWLNVERTRAREGAISCQSARVLSEGLREESRAHSECDITEGPGTDVEGDGELLE